MINLKYLKRYTENRNPYVTKGENKNMVRKEPPVPEGYITATEYRKANNLSNYMFKKHLTFIEYIKVKGRYYIKEDEPRKNKRD
jgi:hypothetical protein